MLAMVPASLYAGKTTESSTRLREFFSMAEKKRVSIGYPEMAGTLYVVSTPIGNLEDLSPRARDVLAGILAARTPG
jgi:hypothetical protein